MGGGAGAALSPGKVLVFDWYASDLTTILTAVSKETIQEPEENLGIFICRGQGKTSCKTPPEIETRGSY